VIFELAVVRITNRASLASLDEALEKIRDIEKRIPTGPLSNKPSPRIAAETRSPDPVLPEPAVSVTPVAVERREEPAKREAEGDNNVSAVLDIWPTLLKLVRAKKISVASYLLEGDPISFDKDGILTIGFPSNYTLHKEALDERGNRDLIEKALRDILKRGVRIKFITLDKNNEEKGSESTGTEAKARGPVEPEILTEPAVQSALEIFEGRIVRRNKIS